MIKNIEIITNALLKSGEFVTENDYSFYYFSKDAGNEMIFRKNFNSKSDYFSNKYVTPKFYARHDDFVNFLKNIWVKFFKYDHLGIIAKNGFEEMTETILKNIVSEEEKKKISNILEGMTMSK